MCLLKMRAILILFVASFTCGYPQYDYNVAQSINYGGTSSVAYENTNQLQQYLPPAQAYSQPAAVQPQYQSQSVDTSAQYASQYQNQQYSGYNQNAYSIPEVTKTIYVHTNPEESPEEAHARQNLHARPRHHYRIIFIKSPNGSIRSAASLASSQVQEKTIIYVLSKKEDALDAASLGANGLGPALSKPEVFFIKYKTPEEAQHAQQQIQAQYESLGGTTQVSNEGAPPVQSFVGSTNSASLSTSSSAAISQNTNLNPGYLPPAPGGLVDPRTNTAPIPAINVQPQNNLGTPPANYLPPAPISPPQPLPAAPVNNGFPLPHFPPIHQTSQIVNRGYLPPHK